MCRLSWMLNVLCRALLKLGQVQIQLIEFKQYYPMTKSKSNNLIEQLEVQVKRLREENLKLNDSILFIKEQLLKERTEKQVYFERCKILERQLKLQALASEKPNTVASIHQVDRHVDYQQLQDYTPKSQRTLGMTGSMCPPASQSQVGKFGYKKKTSTQSQIEASGTPKIEVPNAPLTEKKLKTLKDMRAETNSDQQNLREKQGQKLMGNILESKESHKRLTYFEKVKNKQ